jgi:hypothetical protein
VGEGEGEEREGKRGNVDPNSLESSLDEGCRWDFGIF